MHPLSLMSGTAKVSQPTYYQILQLRQSDQPFDPVEVKFAYRRALLLHHPDKRDLTPANNSESIHQTSDHAYSIDQIAQAYKTLSSAIDKADYDNLLARSSRSSNTASQINLHAGVESLDLEEFAYLEETSSWYYGCRCGDQRGYVLNESDLEENADSGEIFVCCNGCSLSIRVLFQDAGCGIDVEDVPDSDKDSRRC